MPARVESAHVVEAPILAEANDEPAAVDAPPPPPVAEPALATAPALPAIDLREVADLCAALARIDSPDALPPQLEHAARVLDAVGLVVWLWDADAAALRAILAHGYSDAVFAQLPTVDRDADNATAAAFRVAETCIVTGSERANGAIAVPLMTPSGCVGVLGIELRNGGERSQDVRAVATIVGAQLSTMLCVPGAATTADRKLA
jgi:hypothetical protein